MQTKVSNIASPVGNKRTSPPPLKPVNVQFSLPGHHNWCPGVSFASHSSSGVSRIGGGLLIARTAGQKKFIFSNKKDQWSLLALPCPAAQVAMDLFPLLFPYCMMYRHGEIRRDHDRGGQKSERRTPVETSFIAAVESRWPFISLFHLAIYFKCRPSTKLVVSNFQFQFHSFYQNPRKRKH